MKEIWFISAMFPCSVMFLKQQGGRRPASCKHWNISIPSIFSHWVACSQTEIGLHAYMFTHREHLQKASDSIEILWVTWSDDAVQSVLMC